VGPRNTLTNDEGVCHFSLNILAMTSSSDAFLDHIADYLQFIFNAQLFWFMLNMSMTMAATLPVDSVWTRKTTSLCRLSLRRPWCRFVSEGFLGQFLDVSYFLCLFFVSMEPEDLVGERGCRNGGCKSTVSYQSV